MKSWKKRLNEEIENIIPELRADVKNAPIPASPQISSNGGNTLVLSRNAVISIAAVACACLIALVTCLALLLPKNTGVFMFTIEINPAITVVSDENGTVKNVMASNSDADVILSADGVKENIINKNVADAAAYYTDCAARLGYINMENSGSAVRISGYGGGASGELLNKTKASVEDYFMSKGVFAVVLTEAVDREQFSKRSGIPSGTDEEMSKYVLEKETLYSDREAKELSLDELQKLYGNNKNLQEFVTGELSDNLDRLKKNTEDIANLFDLYFSICNHDDNPAPSVLKGYWEVKKYYGDKIEGEFAELVAEMDSALQAYEQDYGVEITNFFQLQRLANSHISVSIERIAQLIENFTYDAFAECSSEIAEILAGAGVVAENISALVKLPQTVEEYFDKISSLLQTEYEYRLGKYQNIYEEVRNPVTRTEYDGFVQDIVSNYGSLENYWKNIHK